MPLNFGDLDPTAIYVGGQAASAVYVGAQQVWPVEDPDGDSYVDKVLALSPAAYWPLNEAAGTSYADLGTIGAVGTAGAGVTAGGRTGPGGGPSPDFSASGSTAHIATANHASFAGPDLTVALWVLRDGGSGNPIAKWTASAGSNSWGIVTTDTLTQGQLRAGASNQFLNDSVVPVDGWHHIAFTVSATARRMFRDGSLTASDAGVTPNTTSTVVAIGGRSDGGLPFDGSIAHVAIWPSVLSDSDIASLATI